VNIIKKNKNINGLLVSALTLSLALGVILALSPAPARAESHDGGLTVITKQDPGKLFYWVLPGKRRLSEQVFGTPENPLLADRTLAIRIRQANRLPGKLSETVPKLLKELPFLVAVPRKLREVSENGERYTRTSVPLPFGSTKAEVTSGSFRFVFKDIQRWDKPGKPTETADEVDVEAEFTDPAGNEYRVEVKQVLQPPTPGWQTGGGVITNTFHHGKTGTGPPLFPEIYTYGAAWTVGDVYVNGELKEANKNKLVHFMTTQIARDGDYRLALDEELPLPLENTIAGQSHHSHMMIMPIKVTHQGPVHEELETAFTLPNGEKQPFIHAMWEADTIVQAPVEGIEMEPSRQEEEATAKKEVSITVEGGEWFFRPETIRVKKGQEVTIKFENVGSYSHNLKVGQFDAKTNTIGGNGQTLGFNYQFGRNDYYNLNFFEHNLPDAIILDSLLDRVDINTLLRGAINSSYSQEPIQPVYLRKSDAEENIQKIATERGMDPDEARKFIQT